MTDRQPPTIRWASDCQSHTRTPAQGCCFHSEDPRSNTQNSQPRHPSLTDARVRVEKGQATHVHDGRGNCSVDAAKPDGLAWKPTRYHAGTPSRIGHRAKPFNGVGVDPVPCALAGSRQGQYWRHARSARHELTSVRKTTAVRRMRRLCSFAWKQSPSFSVHCCPLLSRFSAAVVDMTNPIDLV